MSDGSVHVTISDGIAEITLDRPGKHNAMTPAMTNALMQACADLERDDNVRVVVLKGAGERAFSAGSDIQSLAQYKSAWAFRARVEYTTAIRTLTKPVIAVLKGWVLGGGLEMALASDIRIAGGSAKFAKQIAGFKPVAVQAIKAAVRASLSMSVDDGLRVENELNTHCFSGSDHLEGIKAFAEKGKSK
jgi:enoyl-CoA hydratase/carnithine racemase